jgi:hypothetical protein
MGWKIHEKFSEEVEFNRQRILWEIMAIIQHISKKLLEPFQKTINVVWPSRRRKVEN